MDRKEEFKVRRLFSSAQFFADIAQGDDIQGAVMNWLADESYIQYLEARERLSQRMREIVLKTAKATEGGVIHFYGLDEPGNLTRSKSDWADLMAREIEHPVEDL